MTSNNSKNSLKNQNQLEIKRPLKLRYTISGDGENKEHLGRALIVKWNMLISKSVSTNIFSTLKSDYFLFPLSK
jgi:hypothetical protein